MYKELLVGLACGCATGLQATDPYEIMNHSMKLAEANWSEAPNYSYTRTDANTESGSQPSRKTYQVLMIEGSPYALSGDRRGGGPRINARRGARGAPEA